MLYVLRSYCNAGIGSIECNQFALCNATPKKKGWWEIETLQSYRKINGVWKIRDFGPDHHFPIHKGRTGPLHKIQLEDPDDDGPYHPTVISKEMGNCWVYSPLGPGDDEFAIINSTTETCLQPLYS